MSGSTITGMWRGKKRRMVHKKSRRAATVPTTPRLLAHLERNRYDWKKPRPRRGVKVGRRKLGARRKVSVIQSVWAWVKTGKIRRTTRRRS
jgi:hypothetical protein